MAGGKAATKSSPKNISEKKDESASEIGENELRIEDRIYTISEEFARKHPGGTVIKSKLGSNATQAFHEFHYRTEAKARKWLARLKSREATTKQDPFLDDFDNLRKQLIAEGYFEPSYPHVAYRIIEILLMTFVGYKLVVAGWWWTGMLLLGLMSGRCGWLQHEANHNSLTGNVFVDRMIGSFVFSMGEAGSALWWIRSHNRHHASPQHVGYDADLNTLPVLAFDRIHASMGNPKWLRYQMFWFVPSTWLVVLYWKLYLHPLSIVQKKAWSDGLFLVLHYLVWYHYFSFLGLGGMIFAHFVWGSVEGTYLFVNFALSHTHKEVISKEESEDWVRSAILRTVNVRPNLLVNWWMGFLNLQIEHHLFPQMPQFRQPQVSARVREFATKHGLHYDERGYFETLYATFNNLDTVGREALEELRSQKHK